MNPRDDRPEQSVIARLTGGETVEVPTEGGSMFPVVRNGDRVTVVPRRAHPRRGQVVLAAVGGRWVLHRVVEVVDGRITLRGDNRTAGDPPIASSAVIGIATRVTRDGRTRTLDWPDPVARGWIGVARVVAHVTPLLGRLRRAATPREDAPRSVSRRPPPGEA